MSVLPLAPWVLQARRGILLLGLAWPAVVFIKSLGAGAENVTWSVIGIAFMSTVFGPPSLVLSLMLPTYKLRIIVVPPLLVLFFWILVGRSSTYSGFNLPPQMVLWIISFTAITMLIPQFSSIEAFFQRILKRE